MIEAIKPFVRAAAYLCSSYQGHEGKMPRDRQVAPRRASRGNKVTKTLGRVLLILLAMATAFAQLNTGSITGVVHDPTGAVIPGAKVTLTDTARGFTYPYVTDANGRYIFNQLQPGAYSLRVEANGFTPYERTDITLNVGANVGADATLQIATAGQSVSIESSTPLLNTEDAAVGQTINRTFVNDLPLL